MKASVDRLQHLARPATAHAPAIGKRARVHSSSLAKRVAPSSACPVLWSSPPTISTSSSAGAPDEPDVVVRVQRCPSRGAFGTEPARHRDADHVGAVGRLLGVDRHAVVDRRVGRHHDRTRGDRPGVRAATTRALAARDVRGRAWCQMRGRRARSIARPGPSGTAAGGTAPARKAQARARVEARKRRPIRW